MCIKISQSYKIKCRYVTTIVSVCKPLRRHTAYFGKSIAKRKKQRGRLAYDNRPENACVLTKRV